MSELELVQHLQPASTEVLETMFFTSVLEASASCRVPGGIPAMSSQLKFRGSPSGVFEIDISLDAARSLAAGFLGEDEQELPEAKTEEVVCELANMLCGSFLSRIGDGSTFDLTHPERVETHMESPDACVSFELPEGHLAIALRIEEAR